MRSYQRRHGHRRSTLARSQFAPQVYSVTLKLTASQADGADLETGTAQEAVLHRGKILGLGHGCGSGCFLGIL